ncbi:MAG: bifunctional diaminohydroxyphosphoribosylaminopyrimidine deaminase/5-amino-6-(5-phosphoribosylamino)uracil reductase RibD [Methylophilaceae bacterium]|jgi:diaminohydroxyphosphoribosylaminopyrimidine deaminase/5-amino-6-(5-phosphoribosylamino)uracil reductase|uniref:bifunctional diaminohydroxyphosphoribosylaminopyrimidine deaminase/5-amino-6-(5-phosphoribosylamino)uracil reductase RibD n=1 Tax=Methylobacillus sp. MM3 TaxID=1848039 RepID=UPI0007E216AC|nr:bifunctional diaminohydroxyphosphoribosylaminopyrimidine deaminase/5-amino-6-(5-phosphoribosylamino)uracil reductase RibD [Methylobacillus sp. MM3]OAJ70838.1 riboflavin biosynthesis protein RibD [Methylobacillus sp. MM3]
MFTADDHLIMTQALRLAERGLYTTTPNPRVGCVIVKDGKIIGEGWHERAGGPHAEVHALRQAGEAARGADVYVTLEPCSHHGRTPPCALALVGAGVRCVVAAMRDPNPRVAGGGFTLLESHGIETRSGLMEREAQQLNPGFNSRMTRGRPWVTAKVAASLDGRTALANGVSQWITGPAARSDVQRWRARSCAILTGIGTVLADDPQMTVRELDIGRQPLRVVVDSHLRIPLNSKILQGGNAIIACLEGQAEKAASLRASGAIVLELPAADGHVCLASLMQALAAQEINEVLVEAGTLLNGALLRAGLVDEMVLYYAPTLLGNKARGMFGMPALTEMAQRVDLDILALDQIGRDIRVRARPRR